MTIYAAIARLQQAIDSGWLSEEEEKNISSWKKRLLQVKHSINNSNLLSNENSEILQKIIQEMTKCLEAMPTWMAWADGFFDLIQVRLNTQKHIFKNAILDVTKILNSILERNAKLVALFKNQSKIMDECRKLYSPTQHTFNGTLVVKINQRLDCQAIEGQCYGYVAQWGKDILNGNSHFGIDLNKFKESEEKQAIPHHVLINENIAVLQQIQDIKVEGEFPKALSADRSIRLTNEKSKTFFFKRVEMIDTLITLVNNNPEKIYFLLFGKATEGHACGIRKDSKTEEYHFLDANSGWYKFNNVKDFKAWFIYYYKMMKYEKYYAHEYKIDSMGIDKKLVH